MLVREIRRSLLSFSPKDTMDIKNPEVFVGADGFSPLLGAHIMFFVHNM